MTSHLSIGDFSRATHMTVKTLRHYHDVGLLEPVDVDPQTGYRRYSTEQIPTAQVVRRFRDLGMPLEEIRTVLASSDVPTRNRHISAHLQRLEEELGRTQRAVSALRDLLSPPAYRDSPGIELRSVGAVQAAAITATVEAQDVGAWFQGALGELFATLASQELPETGHAGGVYADELFTLHRGRATVFVPCDGPVRPVGRVEPVLVPPAELAVIEHCGPPSEVDRAYGTLATYVARHALAVDGPIREYYLVSRRHCPDSALWRTEIGWPVFRTGVTDPV
ncbi:MerR family transcriptional regulator [Streptomyces yokosukanensis]|uniref:MerR family transcriptional regulator n=1 Tax=Streptomyces yokosukanensis TaxID=67386 RepID=A0A124HH79_9ACTN|nr:MerR family transcriptional regulator [Streptomyces yokosukanensis]KUN09342.1 MerR family transcriptional regulator [Streptomyces yokosukanensis]